LTATEGVAPPDDAPTSAIIHLLIGVAAFALQDAVVKWLTVGYPVSEIIFFRALFALPACLIVIRRDGGSRALRTRRPGMHAARTLLLLGALVSFFLALGALPLADTVAIAFSAPIFMAALSAPLLGERVGPRRWLAVLIGFAGVVVILRPGAGSVSPAALLALISALCFALGMIVTRQLGRSDTTAAIMFYFTLGTTVLGGLVAPFQWVAPDAVDFGLLAGLGLTGGVGAYCAVQAYRLAPVATVAPFEYSGLLWATLFGYAFWGDVPGSAVIMGAAILVASNLYILRRERRRGGGRGPGPARPDGGS